MGKYFEIRYDPSQWNAPSGGVAMQWTTPYGGLNVQTPENLLGPQFTPDMSNFMLRNGEMRSKPDFKQFLPGPDGTNLILAVGSFLSPSQVWHTVSMTPRGLFQLIPNSRVVSANGTNPWVYLGGPSLSTAPLMWQSYAGVLYYTNGLHLSAWDGAASTPIDDVAFLGTIVPPPQTSAAWPGAGATVALNTLIWDGTNIQKCTTNGITGGVAPTFNAVLGGTTADNTVVWTNMGPCYRLGSVFLGELNNHIVMAYVTEVDPTGATRTYPNRVRWSNNGFNPSLLGVFGGNLGTQGATFDPSVYVNAGSNDLIDVPDIITGMMMMGRSGLIFRQNGITEFTPTGNGVAPFDFNHLWASQNGIGNIYPFSIAQYGSLGMFISYEQIYKITPTDMKAVGGGARDAILADLRLATGSPKASIDRGYAGGYSYLTYHLRIPLATNTRSYVYSFDDDHWMRWTETGVWPTGIANECWI
jgi:hypothetical protein